eukprot:snap_masked-scaffold_28-processed-gene-3.25-mRNA-1 protein AED:0.34 eAED:0.34 QI:0/0/0/0.5/1/1/2/0/256
MYPVLKAVTIMHEKKLIHCDIKSDNILISFYGGSKLCDFGFSVGADRISEEIDGGGASYFMAPEVMKSNKAAFKMNIFSIGMCFANLIGGDILSLSNCSNSRTYFPNLFQIRITFFTRINSRIWSGKWKSETEIEFDTDTDTEYVPSEELIISNEQVSSEELKYENEDIVSTSENTASYKPDPKNFGSIYFPLMHKAPEKRIDGKSALDLPAFEDAKLYWEFFLSGMVDLKSDKRERIKNAVAFYHFTHVETFFAA